MQNFGSVEEESTRRYKSRCQNEISLNVSCDTMCEYLTCN